MKNVAIRFDGYTFPHNPSKLRVDNIANINKAVSPFVVPDSRNLGVGLWTVQGEGELYGSDCLEQYNRLRAVYERACAGVLSMPHMPSMYAYLRELRMTAEPVDDVLKYAFSFIQTKGKGSPVSSERYYTVQDDGESLWDISYANGKTIDELVELNPQVKYIDDLTQGERVRLC